MKRLLKFFSKLLVVVAISLLGIMMIRAAGLDILPNKIFYPLLAGVGILSLVALLLNFRRRTNTIVRIVLTLSAVVIMVASVVGINKINDLADFLDSGSFGVLTPEGENEVEVNTGVNVMQEPFTIYISGVDTRADELKERALSDVNIVLTVNPQTHRVLMTFIPRDYYVFLHGIETNLRDKLTHAGTVGGVALSKATIEDVLGIKIDHYIKVNFSFVRQLVDAVGGITLVSDTDFTAWTDKSCHFAMGENRVDGRCALAFARERMSYDSGDNHRGENQEQVIAKLVEAISQSDLLAKYSEVLQALEGTFETSLPRAAITGLVKAQLDGMPIWTAEAVNLRGTGSMQATYSYPGQALYVAIPDETSIAEAKMKIEETLQTK